MQWTGQHIQADCVNLVDLLAAVSRRRQEVNRDGHIITWLGQSVMKFSASRRILELIIQEHPVQSIPSIQHEFHSEYSGSIFFISVSRITTNRRCGRCSSRFTKKRSPTD